MKMLLPLLAIIMLLLPVMAHADTEITACNQALDISGERYYMAGNITALSYSDGCLWFGNNNVEIDCQGNTIDANYQIGAWTIFNPYGTTGSILRNCIILNSTSPVAPESAGDMLLENNTIINAWYFAMDFGYQFNNVTVINNTFINTGIALSFGGGMHFGSSAGSNWTITGNRFSEDVLGYQFMLDGGNYENYRIYNNYIGRGAVVYEAIGYTPINWNVSVSNDTNILYHPAMGGNFWGYCADDNQDGFCNEPKNLTGESMDWHPLSLFYFYNTTCPTCPVTNCNYTNTTYPPITDMNEVSKNYKCFGAALNIITTYAFCTNSTCGTTNISASQLCNFGCDSGSEPASCLPSPSTSGMWFFILIVALVVLMIFLIRWATKRV